MTRLASSWNCGTVVRSSVGAMVAVALVGFAAAPCAAQPCESAAWTELFSRPGGDAAVVYDSDRQVLVRFDSHNTWESASGDNWTLRAESGPPPRSGFGFVYDPGLHACILHGGSGGTAFSDTWMWNGVTWTLLSAAGPVRGGPLMVYDTFNSRVLLYGGRAGHSQPWVNDLWSWDGSAWTLVDNNGPPLGSVCSMSYDSRRHVLVYYNGSSAVPPVFERETWEFDGVAWARVATTGPSPRIGFGMAFDPVRGVTVLHAGSQYRPSTPLSDTWEWDGSAWTLASASGAGGTRNGFGMAFHVGLGQVVVMGGLNGFGYAASPNTWGWNGTEWTQVGTPWVRPPGRARAGMAYDVARDRTVLFGGLPNPGGEYDTRTWEFDGSQWIVHDVPGPGARLLPAMVYDSARGVSLLYGGGVTDTWAWDGAAWTQVAPAGSYGEPIAMCFDSDRNVVVMVSNNFPMVNTWEWNGAEWTLVAGDSGPESRDMSAMVYDPVRHRAVLFGGYAGKNFADTWEWDGLTWVRVSPYSFYRFFHAMVFDSDRNRIVLFGGHIGRVIWGSFNDTWERVGTTWSQVDNTGPSIRGEHAMAYDAARRQVVLFGGETGPDETWVRRVGPAGADPTIDVQPVGRTIDAGDAVSFAVVAHADVALTYQWRRNGVALVDDGVRIFGATTATLTIYHAIASDAGTYDAVVSHACTSVYSEGVELGVNHCLADFNSDAVVNSQDFFDFLTAYFEGLPAADVDGSGTVDSQDVFVYLEAFFGECV